MAFRFNPFTNNFDIVEPNSLGLVKVDLFDPTTTTLPTGTSATVDGVTLVDGDRVLYTNLSSGNNKIYEVSGVGVSLVFTAQSDFIGSEDPVDGERCSIQRGEAFADQVAHFDGTNWKVNENIRLFDGTNYQEISSIKKSTLTDNASTDVITVALAGSENQEISYSVIRGAGNKEMGKLYVSGTGASATVNRHVISVVGDVGIEFDSSISGSDIKLTATASSTGTDAEMTYYVVRWSDSTGGPGGIPSYAGSGSSTPAAGSTGDVQFRGSGGDLEAASEFNWDNTNKELDLNGLKTEVLSSAITLNDNQTSAANLFTLDATTINHAIIEYSIIRGTAYRTGRLLIVSDGTTTGESSDHVETSDPGVTITTDISGSDLRVRYTSTSTGQSGTFKYSVRKWQ